MNSNILSIRNLCKSYNSLNGEVLTIDNFSLDVKEKEFISIIGSSGCGKSTLLNIISGLDKDYTGSIRFKDSVKTSYMLQEDALLPWLSVYENAILGLKLEKKLDNSSLNYVKYLLNKKVSSLSGGMRQRVALIRTIATKPDLIFLDEPFSALDYQTRLKVSDDIYSIIKEEGITAIMVTHDIAEAISMSDRVVVLSKRPAKLKSIYEINLTDKKNPIHNRKAKEFTEYYDLLWRDIDE